MSNENVFGRGHLHPVSSGVMTAAAHVAREIGLVDVVNDMVLWDEEQCRLSPGERILALAISILFDRTALWRLHELFLDQDLPVLFHPGVVADDFHDDALARALDKAGPQKVFTTLSTSAHFRERRSWSDLSVLHADTTSVSVWGADESLRPGDVRNQHGYSKQHRPDLKQFGIGLLATKEGLPLCAAVHDGNLDDKTWNSQTLERLKQEIPPAELDRMLYVADSALVTQANLGQMRLKFLSRLPQTFGVVSDLQQQTPMSRRTQPTMKMGLEIFQQCLLPWTLRFCDTGGAGRAHTRRFVCGGMTPKDKLTAATFEHNLLLLPPSVSIPEIYG